MKLYNSLHLIIQILIRLNQDVNEKLCIKITYTQGTSG